MSVKSEAVKRDSESIVARIKAGATITAIADEYGTYPSLVKRALNGVGVDIKRLLPTLANTCRENINEWRKEGKTLDVLAEELGVKRSSLVSTLHRLGLKLHHRERMRSAAVDEATEEVIKYIHQRGGNIIKAIRDLGLKVSESAIRGRLAERGIDLSSFRFSYRTYGDWYTLPGKVEECYVNDKKIYARCLRCGSTGYVLYTNLLAAKSTGCMSCRTWTQKTVRVVETGEVYKSLRKAVIKLDLLPAYQRIRQNLNKSGSYEIGGFTIEAVDPSSDG